MLLASVLNSPLYHGTSKKRFESIKKKGFLHGDQHYNNYLAPLGTYLVLGRPLIARRFAQMVAEEDCSTPVVVSVSISGVTEDETIDLTTDEGMHFLYSGYNAIRRLAKSKRRSECARAPREYYESLKHEQEIADQWLNDLLTPKLSIKENTANWDSATLKYICEKANQRLIIAAIQEGTTFNLSYSGKQPKYNISKNYRGIRIRDHVELCIYDVSLINKEELKERQKSEDSVFFLDGFAHAILDTFTPDAE